MEVIELYLPPGRGKQERAGGSPSPLRWRKGRIFTHPVKEWCGAHHLLPCYCPPQLAKEAEKIWGGGCKPHGPAAWSRGISYASKDSKTVEISYAAQRCHITCVPDDGKAIPPLPAPLQQFKARKLKKCKGQKTAQVVSNFRAPPAAERDKMFQVLSIAAQQVRRSWRIAVPVAGGQILKTRGPGSGMRGGSNRVF